MRDTAALFSAMLAALIVSAVPNCGATEPLPPWPFGPGEQMAYQLRWKFVVGGTATIDVIADSASSGAAAPRPTGMWQMRSLATSTGIVDLFYTVRDTLVSTVDPSTLWPIRFEKHQNEGWYHRDSTYVFDQDRFVIHRNGGSVACSTNVHDILSVLFRTRAQRLEVGRKIDFTVYEGGRLYQAQVNVLRRDTVTVPAGTFPCLVAEPVLQSDAIFKQKGRLWIWFTDDSRRIPVLMRSAIPVGSIVAELTAYQPPASQRRGGSASSP